MATINLGAIKFNWRGAYVNSTAYAVDDVVSSGGSSYVCILASTGNATSNGTYWEQMSSAGTNGTNGTDLSTTLTTQGDILYRDGSGLQRLAKGTAGQVLQMNSGATAPEYGTVSSDFVKITTASPVNATTLSIDNIFSASDGYDSYQIVFNMFRPAVSNSNLHMRFINDAGTIQSGGDYVWGNFGQETNTGTGGTNAGQLEGGHNQDHIKILGTGGGVSGNNLHGGARAIVDIINPTKAGYTIIQGRYVMARHNLDNLMNMLSSGVLRTSGIQRGINLFFSSGNIEDGLVTVYGRKA